MSTQDDENVAQQQPSGNDGYSPFKMGGSPYSPFKNGAPEPHHISHKTRCPGAFLMRWPAALRRRAASAASDFVAQVAAAVLPALRAQQQGLQQQALVGTKRQLECEAAGRQADLVRAGGRGDCEQEAAAHGLHRALIPRGAV